MIITFSAFTFLRPKLASLGLGYANVRMELPDGIAVADLVTRLGLTQDDVEAAFVNGRIVAKDAVLQDEDRVGLVPPGTPGPHRALLGISGLEKK